ncbi:MAG: RluA family pseudouridine synthase [Bdellovibrio sp.]|nr:RluA family pseudouridine synthase [Bdellovibrio sp.]
MPLKKITFQTHQKDVAKRLDQVLAERLPEIIGEPLSKGKIRKVIVAGAVYLNGKRVRIASKELFKNARVDVYLDLDKLNQSGGNIIPFELTKDRILFEDEYLIVVDKPAGIPTQPTLDEARVNLFSAVKKYLASSYLGLHHRLDRDTSGVVLMSKSPKANPGLAEGFSERRVTKIYQALSFRQRSLDPVSVKDGWTVRNFLGVNKSSPSKRKTYCSTRSGGDPAHTDFRVIEQFSRAYLIEAQPHTGRTHQIRVHLSEHGLPILGDKTYHGPHQLDSIEIPRTMLHALSLTFIHPIHQNRIAIQSELPGDFKKCLQALRGGPAGF